MKASDIHVAISPRIGYREAVELGAEVERLGLGGVWIPESSSRDAFVMLADIATRTERIELGTGIVNHFSRTPSALAQAAVTVSEAGGDRTFNLGLGSSTRVVIENFHGQPFQRTAQRMRETLEIVRLGAGGQPMEFDGEIFHLHGFRYREKPAPIRLFVAGLAPDMLAVTGEVADGWLPIWPSRQAIYVLREPVAAAARAAGRAMPIVAAYVYTHVGDDIDRSRRAIRRTLAWYMSSGGPTYNNLYRRYGFSEVVDAVEAAWRAGHRDRARALIPDAVIDDMCVVGDPSTALEQFESFRKLGIDIPVIRFPDEVDAESGLEMCAAIAGACGRAEAEVASS